MSGLRWTQEQFEQHQARQRKGGGVGVGESRDSSSSSRDPVGQPAPSPPRSKYRSRIAHVDGIRFDSILEADHYLELKHERAAGQIRYFLRQVPFHLPGGVIYRADFGVCNLDGSMKFRDTKGYDKQEAKNKRKQVADLYGVEIELLRRADVSRQVSAK